MVHGSQSPSFILNRRRQDLRLKRKQVRMLREGVVRYSQRLKSVRAERTRPPASSLDYNALRGLESHDEVANQAGLFFGHAMGRGFGKNKLKVERILFPTKRQRDAADVLNVSPVYKKMSTLYMKLAARSLTMTEYFELAHLLYRLGYLPNYSKIKRSIKRAHS